MVLDLIYNTIPWNYSQHVVEATQVQVEYCLHPHTQIPTHCWQTVFTLFRSLMEHMLISPS